MRKQNKKGGKKVVEKVYFDVTFSSDDVNYELVAKLYHDK